MADKKARPGSLAGGWSDSYLGFPTLYGSWPNG